jgi:hypothetical protein
MIMIDADWCIARGSRLDAARLHALFQRAMSIEEILTRDDDLWAGVLPSFRLWVFFHAARRASVQEFRDRVVYRAIQARSLLCGVPEAERWARRGLRGGGRTRSRVGLARATEHAADWAAREAARAKDADLAASLEAKMENFSKEGGWGPYTEELMMRQAEMENIAERSALAAAERRRQLADARWAL